MPVRSLAVAAFAVVVAASTAVAKDYSARDADHRSPAELCCTEGASLPQIETAVAPDTHAMLDVNRLAPASEPRPGLDGADWNCRRPDGSRRCFSSMQDQ